MEDWIETEEERARETEWLSTLPAEVQALARICPSWVPCYRMTTNDGHYRVISYAQSTEGLPPLVVLAHGEDSFSPGVAVVGVPPEEMIPCGCGEWKEPTREQINIARMVAGQPPVPEVRSATIH
jgi:hypothetical protein